MDTSLLAHGQLTGAAVVDAWGAGIARFPPEFSGDSHLKFRTRWAGFKALNITRSPNKLNAYAMITGPHRKVWHA